MQLQSSAPGTSPQNTPSGQAHGAVRISLDQAIQMALQHNHTLKAARTTIQQSEALEITANLRPNPVLTSDAQFLPIFQPSEFTVRIHQDHRAIRSRASATFSSAERNASTACKPLRTPPRRPSRRSRTTSALSPSTSPRNSSASQLAESTLDLALQDMKSFQNTVDISRGPLQSRRHQRSATI